MTRGFDDLAGLAGHQPNFSAPGELVGHRVRVCADESHSAIEEPLHGGNISAGVVRVGDTVRRPVGSWSPAVHALLQHLERVGFAGSPRFLGTDDRGREILTYHPGTTSWPDKSGLLDPDETLTRAATLVAGLHRAVRSFAPPDGAAWWPGSADPAGGSVVLHGDLAPWNIVAGEAGWVLIDWDSASPGRLEWELAYVLHTFVPLWHTSEISDSEAMRRVRLFAEVYGLGRQRLFDSLSLIPSRLRKVADFIDEQARGRNPPFVWMKEEGHDARWRAAAVHAGGRLPTWTRVAGCH